MMGFKAGAWADKFDDNMSVSEQWWDLKVYVFLNGVNVILVLANNDGI